MHADSTIFLVDDDPSVRAATGDLLAAWGMHVVAFASASEYIANARIKSVSCLLLDLHLPDISGLDLQRRLADQKHPPIVFISGDGDIPSTVRAMKAGAVDFLSKPFRDADLLEAIKSALERHRRMLARDRHEADLWRCHAALTPREREVFKLVVSGLLNKQAAATLGISEVTLQNHRGQVMRKMKASSFAELVRMAVRLGELDKEAEGGDGAP